MSHATASPKLESVPHVRHRRESSPRPSNWHENAPVTDITVHWLYEAHSVTLLGIVVVLIIYFAFQFESTSPQDNIWHAIYMAIFVFLAVGCLVFPAGNYFPNPRFFYMNYAYTQKKVPIFDRTRYSGDSFMDFRLSMP